MRAVTQREAFYDQLAASHEWEQVTNRYETHRRLQLIFDRLLGRRDLRGMRFLDAGSGGGHFSAVAAARGAEVWSLDVGANLLRQVADRCRAKCIIGSVLDLPFSDKTFDVVLCSEVIEHTPDPLTAIRELCRVVRAGGTLLITTPCRFWQPIVRLATALHLRPYNGFENFLWPWQLAHVVRSEGLEIRWAEGFNFCPLFWQPLDPFFRFGDWLFGRRMPWLMVNYGIMAVRPADALSVPVSP
jgi:2-polyprenyl-3-methyl-5-hydroxy-6-metoxy-1,4-benzoquinol methylase